MHGPGMIVKSKEGNQYHQERVSFLEGCCAVPCCAVLCCAVLCCAVLCCAVLCCAVQCRAILLLWRVQSSSPSYLLLASLDAARAVLTVSDCSSISLSGAMLEVKKLTDEAHKMVRYIRNHNNCDGNIMIHHRSIKCQFLLLSLEACMNVHRSVCLI